MNLYLIVLILYSTGMIAIGLWIGRRVRGSTDFFVAGRALGPGLILSTMLAANIGAGSTVGATAIGYTGGIAAWWWVGAAAIGQIVMAIWVGPAMRRIAAAHDLRTVGDYLEFRYSAGTRGLIAVMLWFGTLFILAGQLVAIGTILNSVTGTAPAVGCAIGGAVIMIYFTAGGLLTTARVNALQLAVKLGGFAIALPIAAAALGGWDAVARVQEGNRSYWSFWQPGPPGLMYLALLTPSFIVSPGLLQKVFGARDDRAVRIGVGLNAAGLFLYAAVPALLGIIARGRFESLPTPNAALPFILVSMLPPIIGAIGLAAVFSAEVSASDAALFMLTTSLSQDLYKRFVNPAASDARLLFVARCTTAAAALSGVALAIALGDVVEALTIFYTIVGVSLFVPILAGLYLPAADTPAALTAIVSGVGVVLVIQFSTSGRGIAGMTPALIGLVVAAISFGVVYVTRTSTHGRARAI